MSSKLTNWILSLIDKYGLALFVVIPVVIALVYSGFFAHSYYTVESQVIIRESDSNPAPMLPGLALGFLGNTSISLEDSYILEGYLKSGTFLEQLDAEFDLRSHYNDTGADILNRLSGDASKEDFLEYFRSKLDIKIDPESKIISMLTTAFTPEMAKDVNLFMLEASEDEINRLNRIISKAQTQFAKSELEVAESFLIGAEEKLLAFQYEKGIADANSEAASLFTRISELEGALTAKETELKGMLKYIREDTIPVRALKQEIEAIKQQLEEEDNEMSGSADGSMLPVIKTFHRLRMEVDFATQAYASSFAALEAAKLEVTRQEKFLLLVAPPELPEEPSGPKPLLSALTVLVVALLLFGILKLIIATIRDHTI